MSWEENFLSLVFGNCICSFLLVILFDISAPNLKLFSKVSFNVNVPLDEPIEFSFCLDLSGTKASISSLNFNLFPDWEAKWTVGVQKPETQIQSQSIISVETKSVLSLFNFPIVADFTFLYPLAASTACENLISIFKSFASLINSEFWSSLVSSTIGSTPFFLNSIAVS